MVKLNAIKTSVFFLKFIYLMNSNENPPIFFHKAFSRKYYRRSWGNKGRRRKGELLYQISKYYKTVVIKTVPRQTNR